jgi:hypothetical protein
MKYISNIIRTYIPFRQVNDEMGLTLIEVALALGIMSFVGVALVSIVLGGLQSSFLASEKDSSYITAETLAKSQMEYVKGQTYSETDPPEYDTVNVPSTEYVINCTATRMDPKGDGTATDDGLQRIVVRVLKDEVLIVEYVGYKVK